MAGLTGETTRAKETVFSAQVIEDSVRGPRRNALHARTILNLRETDYQASRNRGPFLDSSDPSKEKARTQLEGMVQTLKEFLDAHPDTTPWNLVRNVSVP